jgi:hypothetical protein
MALQKVTVSHIMQEEITDHVMNWVHGQKVDTLQEFLAMHGRAFRNYRYTLSDMDFVLNGPEFVPQYAVSAMMHRFNERERYISELGFSIPCQEVLDFLAGCQPILEIGAGTGFWSRLLANRGVDVIATDTGLSGKRGYYGFVVGSLHPTIQLQGKTAVRRFPDRNVFCSWPTLNHTWFRQAVRAMRIGRMLIVVREDAVAEDSAWDYIERAFVQVANIEIPCFENLHDHVEIWLKKRDVLINYSLLD